MQNNSNLNALCIHGIQSTPEDWLEIEHHLSNTLNFEHAERLKFREKSGGLKFEKWQDQVVLKEQDQLRSGMHKVIITHSYATHRAGLILQNSPNVDFAVLINPPLNKMDEKEGGVLRESAPDDAFMNALFHEITFDMSDEVYAQFIKRQRKSYECEGREIGRQGAFLKKGEPFTKRLTEIPANKEVLIIRASGDPWDVGEIQENNKVTVVNLGPNYGHYPHVSKPEDVSHVIRSWMHERIFSEIEADRAFQMEPVSMG